MLLTGHKGLKTRCHPETQLVNERRLVLGVDLNFDPRFKRRLVCGRQEKVRTLYSGDDDLYAGVVLRRLTPKSRYANEMEKRLFSFWDVF